MYVIRHCHVTPLRLTHCYPDVRDSVSSNCWGFPPRRAPRAVLLVKEKAGLVVFCQGYLLVTHNVGVLCYESSYLRGRVRLSGTCITLGR